MAEERNVNRIDELRQQIDDIDARLVELLSRRAACALAIGHEKKVIGLEVYQPSREAEVLGHVQQINPGPLDNGAMKRLFERIIDEARRLERVADTDEQTAPERVGEAEGRSPSE